MLGLPGVVLLGGDVGSRAPPVCGENGFPGTDRALRTLTFLPLSFPPTPKSPGVMPQLNWGPLLSPAFEGTFE
uniref:Uncharacterized protein n=2 Tax=Cercopithecinae TaxID=9528 RepID=A0A2K5XUI6_MANLE|nr:unnamed protein product [Macaca fascicularis]